MYVKHKPATANKMAHTKSTRVSGLRQISNNRFSTFSDINGETCSFAAILAPPRFGAVWLKNVCLAIF
jgi:hypothetical protein